MKKRVYHIGDENMAGSVWGWSFFVNRTANGRFTVSCSIKSSEPAFYKPDAESDLRTGAEVYRSLTCMIEEAGYCEWLPDDDIAEIAAVLQTIDGVATAEFVAAANADGDRIKHYAWPSG